MDILGKRIENPVDYQSEGTKLIYLYNRGTYGGTYRGTRVRYDDVRTVANASGAIEQRVASSE